MNELSDLSKFLTICWQIWNDRYNVIFRQGTPCPERIHIIASSVGQEFFKANFRAISIRNLDNYPIIKWHTPNKGFIKLNFNGSASDDKAGACFVVPNEDGFVIGVGDFNLNGATINEVEARALKEGFTYIKRKGFNKVLIGGDSKLILGRFNGRSNLHGIFALALMTFNGSLQLVHQ
ncbi:uncharacterized protein [Pyrus communis]|uniref:uncharacterized protein n=1 Tax=Pyrus communis TaxID=23211 RepID=UPI0035C145E9